MVAVATVSAFLKKGGVVICPTDTVYGFLADASNKKAVDKIYKIKKRSKSKPLSVFVKDLKMAGELAEIDRRQVKVLKKYWPGKYTFILKRNFSPSLRGTPKQSRLPRRLLASRNDVVLYGMKKDNTVAIRIPDHAFLKQVLIRANKPLAQTSVNISGKDVLDKISDIIKQFGKTDILIIDGGDIKKGKPSKIVDLTSNKINVLRK